MCVKLSFCEMLEFTQMVGGVQLVLKNSLLQWAHGPPMLCFPLLYGSCAPAPKSFTDHPVMTYSVLHGHSIY
jgi:hypothetical protein